MSSNRRIYRHTRKSLMQLYPQKMLNGHQIRHLNTLSIMISGIVQGKQCHLEQIALKIPDGTQTRSKVQKFARLLQNETVNAEIFFLPFIMPLLVALANAGLILLAIDGSETGQRCMTLMMSVIYRKRAIPIAWITEKGNKGHLSEELHVQLIEKVIEIVPDQAEIVVLGDGEFDGIQFQAQIEKAGWEYVLRTAKNTIINDDGDEFSLKNIGLKRGEQIELFDVRFTKKHYGPVSVAAWWDKNYDEPIYLVTRMACLSEACDLYRKRYCIETFFSDEKSRGFNLQRSRLKDPERVERFLIAACLAYIWMIYLGTQVLNLREVMKQIHRVDRCDLSLFQLGLRYVEHLLNHEQDVPISFMLPTTLNV